MLKKLLSIAYTLLMILSSVTASAHAIAIKRNNCWGFLSYKYKTGSQVSKFAGVLNGRHPYYVSVGDDVSYGCNAPKYSFSTYSYDNNTKTATAWGKAEISGTQLFSFTNHWSLMAGTNGPKYPIDKDAFEQMSKDGFTKGETSEKSYITDDKIFKIENLSGVLKIQQNSNFYSTYKVIVMKERNDVSEDEYYRLNDKYMNLEFENIVAEGEITISKNNISTKGLFSGINLHDKMINSANEYGVNLDGINMSQSLDNIELNDNEEFTIVTYVDGGLDFSSVRLDEVLSKNSSIDENIEQSIKIYPNPTKDFLSFQINNYSTENDPIIKIINNMGTIVYEDRKKIKNKAVNTINIEKFQPGIYFLILEFNNIKKTLRFIKH